MEIEEAKAFIADARKDRADWLEMANKSWDELKKRDGRGKMRKRRRNGTNARYPAWYSIFKIRQGLVLARAGIPVCKDTTQDGNDGVGAVAAIMKERLAINLFKDQDFFDVVSAAANDFLATNFGQVRLYYERDEIPQKVLEPIQPMKLPTGEPAFVDGRGKVVDAEEVYANDEGYFLEHEEVVDVENERVCVEPVLYKHFYVEPGVTRWSRTKRIAFEEFYSEPQFKRMFGADALAEISRIRRAGDITEASKKNQDISVFEIHDAYEGKTYWFTEEGEKFLTPTADSKPNNEEALEDVKGLYDLDKMFPCPKPMVMNSPTDSFYPVTEFYQLEDIFGDIHTLFGRMVRLTWMIRSRLLFDNNIDGLQAALNEAAEGDAFGVPNLAQALSGLGGNLDRAVQYVDVTRIIQALEQVYNQLEQRLNAIYRLTGTSDLLQGLVSDPTQRTLGEQQMTEKYARNQLQEPQRKVQEFIRDIYELGAEMALKNFKDDSLEAYIMPQTMQPQDRELYEQALGMLKENHKRFRTELETDSTIALNEQYDKQMRIELVNTVTQGLERVANIAQQSPALVALNLHTLKYLIQGFRQGKMFQTEVTTAIDNVIKQAEDAAKKAPPQFNKDEAMANLKKMELDSGNQISVQRMNNDAQIRIAQIQSTERMESMRIQSQEAIASMKAQQESAIANLESQLEQFKAQMTLGKNQSELQLSYEKMQAEMAIEQQTLALKRDEIMAMLQKSSGEYNVAQFRAEIEKQVKFFEMQLAEQNLALETQRTMLDEREKYMTEARLQQEHELQRMESVVKSAVSLHQAKTPEAAPIHVTVQAPTPTRKKKKIKIERDEFGNPIGFESFDAEEPAK